MMMVLAVVAVMAGCGSFENSLSMLSANVSKGDYRITVWSGGKAVAVWEIGDSYVNSEENSGGWFFMYQGKLVRVSGTVTIEEL